jgi:sugar phosphate isomerase/epimerase
MPEDEAQQIAKEFFAALGEEAQAHDVQFCIEPNAPDYACDFITDAKQGIEIVKEVASPGFWLHLDIACMALAGDDVTQSIHDAADVIRHFHISAPMLGQVEASAAVPHRAAAAALRDINYQGYVSIEMRPGDEGTNVDRVERAVRFAKEVYTT